MQQSLQKRRLLSSIKINKREREVDEAQSPAKRSREPEDLEEGEILENCCPSRPAHVTLAPAARLAEQAIPSHSASLSPVTDLIRIMNPAYILPPTMPLSRIPGDLEGRAQYSNQLQAFCNGLRRAVFKDQAELKILRSIGTTLNSKTIPHLPTSIKEAQPHVGRRHLGGRGPANVAEKSGDGIAVHCEPEQAQDSGESSCTWSYPVVELNGLIIYHNNRQFSGQKLTLSPILRFGKLITDVVEREMELPIHVDMVVPVHILGTC